MIITSRTSGTVLLASSAVGVAGAAPGPEEQPGEGEDSADDGVGEPDAPVVIEALVEGDVDAADQRDGDERERDQPDDGGQRAVDEPAGGGDQGIGGLGADRPDD